MKEIHSLILGAIIVTSVTFTLIHIKYGLSELDVPERSEYLWVLIFTLLVAMWAVKEPKQTEHKGLSPFGAFMFFAWPLVLPYHLVKTRGIEGLVLFLGFVGLYYLPFIAGLIAYVYYT